jgi:LmbE family N-acetylglucosaminyl deacetylase
MSALFVFAHQDDEVAAASRILFELESGTGVHCVFLTDGAGRVGTEIRNRESLAVLTSLGVPPDRIGFIGSEIPIADGTLVEHLDVALERLDDRIRDVNVGTIYCLAWEGGHQDHDAAQLVAAAFAKRRGLLDRCFELPLYNGRALPGPLFRVLSPLPAPDWQRRRLSFRQAFRLSFLGWRYRSQRSSWIGLIPAGFLKLAVFRREWIRHVDPARFRSRPHRGSLFYERRFRFPYEQFVRASSAFIDAHF